MNSWGYIWTGLACAVVATFLLFAAQPSDFDVAMAAFDQATGEAADPPKVNEGLQFVGYLFALGSAVLTPIGLIGQGVRIGSRESRRDRDMEESVAA